MEAEDSLPHSQVPATCPYPESTRWIQVYFSGKGMVLAHSLFNGNSSHTC